MKKQKQNKGDIMKKTKQETVLETKQSSKLGFIETEQGIKLVKDAFEKALAEELSLLRVTAPRFLVQGTGLQDDLAGTQVPVSFKIKDEPRTIEFVHSLAKWKRFILGKHHFPIGRGLYTDMDAVRKDEKLSEIHSAYVDQWDWELVISKEQRSLDFLKSIVEKIFGAMKKTEATILKELPVLRKRLPDKITFVHAEDLERMLPESTDKEREDFITKKHGAVFLIGIGHPLVSGKPHDLRAADYDDWSTETKLGYHGLDGDILVWDDLRQKTLELSSMGIRVDKKALELQLKMHGLDHLKKLDFHKSILDETIPLTIGGGIGQSRLCMFFLEKRHIGEVQSSVWPESMEKEAEEKGIYLL